METLSFGPVLVTGSSTGIGRCICEYLATRGIIVYATARTITGLQWISLLPPPIQENLIPVQLDVTDIDSILRAVDTVKKNDLGLFAIVNNAGLGDLGFHSTFTEQEIYNIFNVNTFGPWRVTNAFLPLLIQAMGRVINIGSQGGSITKKLYGPYSMTKYALEAYSESLRAEISEFGLSVSIIQPGGIISNIGSNSTPGIIARLKRAKYPFKSEADAILQQFEQTSDDNENQQDNQESETNRRPSSPEIVAEAVADALSNPQPKRRYLVGTKWEGNRVITALIERLLDENNNPVHNYTREQLFSMIDDQISQL